MKPLMYPDRALSRFWHVAPETFFGRTIDDILDHDFFQSFDANIREDAQQYKVEIAVPGMSKNDINVVVENHVLKVTAQKQKSKRRWWKQTEFNGTYLQRSFVLPEGVAEDSIRAHCKNGLLTITIEKLLPKTNSRRIAIRGAASHDARASWWAKWKAGLAKLVDKVREDKVTV